MGSCPLAARDRQIFTSSFLFAFQSYASPIGARRTIGEVGLPHLVRPRGLVLELVIGLDEKEWDRPRRIRDAVEAALSDVILLGTDEQVKLATDAANALVAGEPVKTEALVVSLRNFIREALALEPVSAKLIIPQQGPARPTGTAARKGKDQKGADSGGKGQGGMGGGGAGGAGFSGTATEDTAQGQSR